jgi:RNA polymerase sigma-70 factor (family 1)
MEISVEQIRNGNIKSFEKVYKQYHTKLYFYVLKHTQSSFLAEETVQLTFIKLWENRQDLSASHDLSTQIFRTAKSTMIDLLRKERTLNKHISIPAENSPDLFTEPDIIYKDELQRLHVIIEEMSPARRTVFKLSRFEDLSHKEIARQLSISPKTVENHIGNAIKQLKERLLSIFL